MTLNVPLFLILGPVSRGPKQEPRALPYLQHIHIAYSQFWAWYYETNVGTCWKLCVDADAVILIKIFSVWTDGYIEYYTLHPLF